eukprot:CAMPEP_0174890542 /NCGR_PEP_ID=MMETSP0167-20121228/5698_1 /TAXON_ID=38298 /ORGANISM="Rhodella maculata, Strain CCMP736" /LENGTH=82 /DNA_ID=CAMNT_0016128385 /DNA_START=361 /DNA_END=606 /DNA_ORIENTATION=+
MTRSFATNPGRSSSAAFTPPASSRVPHAPSAKYETSIGTINTSNDTYDAEISTRISVRDSISIFISGTTLAAASTRAATKPS